MKNRHAEMGHIKKDINALKANGSALAKDIRHDGVSIMRNGFRRIRNSGNYGLHRMEDSPGQILALGIIGGLILSYFLNRRNQ